jgi:hypothetical protein
VLRLNRPARLAAVMVFGALALSGCANDQVLKADSSHGPHTVRLTVSSTEIPTRLTYRVGSAPALAVEAGGSLTCAVVTNSTSGSTPAGTQVCPPRSTENLAKFATTTVKVAGGTKVSMNGGPPLGSYTISGTGDVIPTDSFTCSIAVDGVVRVTHLAQSPFGARPPTCSATGYVGSRPFQLRRLMEFIAFALCLLIVIFGIAVQVMPTRQRA